MDVVPAEVPAVAEAGGLAGHAVSEPDDGDLYTRLKALQQELEFLEIQVLPRSSARASGRPVLEIRALQIWPGREWAYKQATSWGRQSSGAAVGYRGPAKRLDCKHPGFRV